MAANDLFSASWHRVAGLRPRLRGHAKLSRHFYRGQLWYVLQDQSSRRVHRFSPATYTLIGLMDGHRSVQEIWDATCAKLGDDAPTQEEVIRLLSQLHGADVLQCEIPPDVDELLRRQDKMRSMKLIQLLMSPLSVKFPLLDPERFLSAAMPYVRPFFSWYGTVLWLALVTGALVLAGLHWGELTKDITDRVLAPQNLLIIWFTFPVLKAFHEFGHAFAVKRWGGEVHEMGVMLLVLMPVPYVDASAATAFRDKYPRAVVGGAGMLVEMVDRGARHVPLGQGRAGHGARGCLQRDADRRRFDGAVQRQSAAALRRLLHLRRPDRDPQPAHAREPLFHLSDRTLPAGHEGICRAGGQPAARSAGSCCSR